MRSSLLLAVFLFLASTPARAMFDEAAFFAPSPLIDAGFRFQTVDRGTRPDRLYIGTQLLLIKVASGSEGGFWSFLNPGIQYQDNREVVFSVSPVARVGANGLGAALEVFPIGSGRSGGVFGFSVGYHWF
jgi:hypothetical protein